MKKTLSFILVATLIITATSCSAQLVKTIKDIPLINTHQNEFVGKPLSLLLNNIKPKIKLFFTNTTEPNYGSISFYFVDHPKFAENSKLKHKMTRVIVFVTGAIAENDYSLPIQQRFNWTDTYKEKNKDLIVQRILIRQGSDTGTE